MLVSDSLGLSRCVSFPLGLYEAVVAINRGFASSGSYMIYQDFLALSGLVWDCLALSVFVKNLKYFYCF